MNKHHRIVPVALIAFGIPFTLVVGFLLVANLLFHDEKPPDDSALLLPNVTVAEADNAYAEIQKLSADFTAADPNAWQPFEDKSVDQMLSGGAWDDTHATAVLTKYAAAINDFHAAAKKPQYQDPSAAHPSMVSFENLYLNDIGGARTTGKLVALESLRKVRNGDVVGGLDEAAEVVRLAHRLESGQPTLIQWLVGSATKQVGLSALRQIAMQTTLSAEQEKNLAPELERYRDSQAGLVKVMKMEYAYAKSYQPFNSHFGVLYDQFYVSGPDGTSHRSMTGRFISFLDDVGVTRFYFWPNQNRRFTIENTKQMVAVAQTDCTTGDLSSQLPPQRSAQTGLRRLFEPNAAGKLIADLGRISLGGIVPKRCHESLAVSATQVSLALSAYQHDHNKLPESLDALVPKYLASVPVDPYSGQGLIYVPAGKIVYSVGQDRKDEHGNTKMMTDYATPNGEWQNMFDPTFVISK